MKILFGILLILAGIVFGLWAGLWWAFIGGIIQVIEAVKATPVDALNVAWGIVRFAFSGIIGWAAVMVLALPGAALIGSSE